MESSQSVLAAASVTLNTLQPTPMLMSTPSSTPLDNPPNPILYVPSILLALLVVVNIAVVTIALGLLVRSRQKRTKKRNDFTVRMTDIEDQFADEIQYQSYREAMALYHTRTLTHATTTTRGTQTNITSPPSAAAVELKQEEVEINNKLEPVQETSASKKVEVQMIPVQQPEKDERKQHEALNSSLSVQLSSNAAYRSQEELNLLPYDEDLGESMDVQTNMAYGDTKPPESGPGNHSKIAALLAKKQQKNSNQGAKHNSSIPNLSVPNYTYIDTGNKPPESCPSDNNKRAPPLIKKKPKNSYQCAEENPSTKLQLSVPTLSSSPNYTYIDSVVEREYIDIYESPTEMAPPTSDDGPAYTYIDHEITETGSQEGDYYSTIHLHY